MNLKLRILPYSYLYMTSTHFGRYDFKKSLVKLQYNLSLQTVSIKRSVSIKGPVLTFLKMFLLKDQYNPWIKRIIG